MAERAYIVTKGVVLRETETKEADKILTLLTADRGKISVIARGVRRKSCKYAACAQQLVYSEWTLDQKGEWSYANEGATAELFNGLRGDLEAMALGFYFAELTEAVTSEESPAPELLRHLLNGLYALSVLHRPHALVKASFSCPFRCAFCYCTMMNGGVYTQRPLSDVLADIEALEAERIWLVDDDFLLNRERVVEFCDLVLKRGVRKQFMAYARADFPAEHPDLLPLLYRAGFRDILVGLEAADDATLDAYHKETGRAVNEAAIRNLRAAGLVCNGLFVVSHASTREDFRNLLDFIRKNRLLWVVFGIFTPYKGSDAYEEYRDRLLTRKAKKLDGLHVTIRPEHMSKLMFYLRVVLLHAATYPKLLFRILRGTAYDTEKDGWW